MCLLMCACDNVRGRVTVGGRFDITLHMHACKKKGGKSPPSDLESTACRTAVEMRG